MFTILVILTLIYAALKFYNTRDEFRRRDAERAKAEQEAADLLEEEMETEEMFNTAVDVDDVEVSEVIDVDDDDVEVIDVDDVEVVEEVEINE